MTITVTLEWASGDPAMNVTELDSGVHAAIDLRLSAQQVRSACDQLDDVGESVWKEWQRLVGFSETSQAT